MTGFTTYKENHNTFGGVIYSSDFSTDHDGTRDVADRICKDWRFDEQCKRNMQTNLKRGKNDR